MWIRLLASAMGVLLLVIPVSADDVDEALKTVTQVAAFGHGHVEALSAVKSLRTATAADVPRMLTAMNDANQVATNWLRPIVESAAEKGELDANALDAFVADTANGHRSRRLAFELLQDVAPGRADAWLPKLLDDASPELRYEAVATLLTDAANAPKDDQKKAILLDALDHSRVVDQIREIAKGLDDVGHPVDFQQHFGFLTDWYLIASFDNVDGVGFDTIYEPESGFQAQQEYQGKNAQPIQWHRQSSDDSEGKVDINDLLGKEKGAVAYAYTNVSSNGKQEVHVRLGTPNANKVWVNGDLVIENEVYHAGDAIDQYIGTAHLQEGNNSILVKVCQNEQRQSWAQEWFFQLRITDLSGKAVPVAASAE